MATCLKNLEKSSKVREFKEISWKIESEKKREGEKERKEK